MQSGSRKNQTDGVSYKEECNEVEVRRNKLCSWCTCISLSVNVEWIWLSNVGQVKEEVPMWFKQFPRQFQIPLKNASITFVKQQQYLHNPII